MISPNKQNLLLVQKQKKIIQNGLKLLKEKRNSLIVLFLDMAKEGKKKQAEVNEIWSKFSITYLRDTALIQVSQLLKLFVNPLKSKVKISRKRVSGVYLDQLELSLENKKWLGLKKSIGNSLELFREVFPEFVSLAQIKSNSTKISKEIIKTNRQISNLENTVLEKEAEIKFIKNALQEKSNAEKAVLIKMFT